jgi:hypothetical protein
MFQRLNKLNQVTTFASVLSLLTIAPVQAQVAPPEEPAGDAGFFIQYGGPVKRKLARTQTLGSLITESVAPTTWKRLNLATLAHSVPAGTTDLFNVSFTAECRLFGASQNDYLRIRIMDLNTGVPLEPYDGFQAFCSADNYATYTGMWSKRLGAGVHTLQVEVWILDSPGAGVLTAWLDDWTFEAVIYD